MACSSLNRSIPMNSFGTLPHHPLGRIPRSADRRHARRRTGRASARHSRFRSRSGPTPQRRQRDDAAPGKRPAADRVGTLQGTHHGRTADARLRKRQHPFGRLRQPAHAAPSFARRPHGGRQVRRVERPAGRRHFSGRLTLALVAAGVVAKKKYSAVRPSPRS